MSIIEEIKEAIIDGDILGAGEKTRRAVGDATPAAEILHNAALPAIREVGDLWNRGRYFLPEVVMSSEAFNEVTAQLRSRLSEGAQSETGRVLLGTVQGDLHDLGKNIVAAMLVGAGFQVTDLGVDVPDHVFIEKAMELEPDVLGIGAYMSTTMRSIPKIIRLVDEQQLRPRMRIMVGGIPVTPKFASEAGADAYGEDAFAAVRIAEAWIRGGKE